MARSKFIEYNKYTTDYDFGINTVSIWHKAFNYTFETRCEEMRNIAQAFNDNFKYSVKYNFDDYKNEDIISIYGISKNTSLFIQSIGPREYIFIFNKYTPAIINRFLMIKAYAYIWMGRLETGYDLRLTFSSTNEIDEIAEHIAIEFLLPKWKLKILYKSQKFSDEWLLENNNYLNMDLLEICKKWNPEFFIDCK